MDQTFKVVATGFATLALTGAAQAGQDNLSFTQQAAGSAMSFTTLPSLNVVITDDLTTTTLASNQLQFVVTLGNTSAYPTQTLTQLFLNDSAFIGLATLPTVTVTPSVTGGTTLPSVTLSSTQSLSSGAVAAANTDTGKGDFQLSLLNNGTAGVMNSGHALTETFTVSFAGLASPVSALNFDNLSVTTGGATYSGVAAFTNVNGTQGGLGALVVASVPEPSSAALAIAGLLGLVGFGVRKRKAG